MGNNPITIAKEKEAKRRINEVLISRDSSITQFMAVVSLLLQTYAYGSFINSNVRALHLFLPDVTSTRSKGSTHLDREVAFPCHCASDIRYVSPSVSHSHALPIRCVRTLYVNPCSECQSFPYPLLYWSSSRWPSLSLSGTNTTTQCLPILVSVLFSWPINRCVH